MVGPRNSPLQNRVLPTGEIVAHTARGLFTGNRGNLKFSDGRLGVSRWKHAHWIICDLTHPRGKTKSPTPDRTWTPLFFLDESVALAAGHRPCAYCRPDAYRAFKSAWIAAHGPMNHKDIDRILHQSRVSRSRQQVRHEAQISDLPDGAHVLINNTPHLVHGDHLRAFTPGGYGAVQPKNTGPVTVLTPKPIIETLRMGFRPILHDSIKIV